MTPSDSQPDTTLDPVATTTAAADIPVAGQRPLALLVSTAGAPWMLLAFLARLPVAMLPLTVLVSGQVLTGSFAAAGLLVGALSLGGVVGAPLVGALADRIGHRRTLVVITIPGALGLLGLIGLFFWPAPLGVALALSALVGASNAQVGPLARASWSTRFAGHPDARHRVEVAMGYETVADEVSYVAGPVLGATLAAVVSPVVALSVTLVLLVCGQLGFALLNRSAQARVPGVGRRLTRPGLLAPWIAIAAAVGLVFGSVQASVTASLADTASGFTGVVYAFIGIGSATSGMLTHKLARWSLPDRVIGAGILLALAGGMLVAAALLTGGPFLHAAALAAACLAVGLCVAPLLVSSYAAAERLASAGNTLVLTLLATATLAGVGLGASAAGMLVEAASVTVALAIPVLVGVVCAALGVGVRALNVDAFAPTVTA